MEEKITIKRTIISIIAGFIAIQIFRFGFSFALQHGYGIDTNVYFAGRVNFHIFNILSIIVCGFLGAVLAGMIIGKKGWLIGALVPTGPYLIVWIFAGAVIFFRGLTPYGETWLKQQLTDQGIWLMIELIPCIVGGWCGQYLYEMEKLDEEITGEKGIFSFYFTPKARVFLTIPFLSFVPLYLFVFQIQKLSTIIRWGTIGLLYTLLHPRLWLIMIFWELIYMLLTLAFLIPVLSVYWVYKISYSPMSKLKKTLAIIGTIIGVYIGSSAAGYLGYLPIHSVINSVTSRGKQVWAILLDRHTYPIAHGNLYEYYKEKDPERAMIEKTKAKRGFIKLADSLYRSGNYRAALAIYSSAIYFAEDEIPMKYKMGLAYFSSWKYDEALECYNEVLEHYPDNVATNCNVALIYTVTNHEKRVDQWKKCKKLLLDLPMEFKGKEDFIGWVENYIESPEQYYPSYQMQDYITGLPPNLKNE